MSQPFIPNQDPMTVPPQHGITGGQNFGLPPAYLPAPAGMVRMGDGKLVPISRGSSTPITEKKLLIVFQYWQGDMMRVISQINLVCDLERVTNQDADVMLFGRDDAPQMHPGIIAKLTQKFGTVHEARSQRMGARGFPYGANEMWHDLVMQCCNGSLAQRYYGFLNLEHDVVPTRPGWIGALADAAKSAFREGALVLGHINGMNNGPSGTPPIHVNGVAVYSTEIGKRLGNAIWGCPANEAYDVHHRNVILPVARDSSLLFLDYRRPTITEDALYSARRDGNVPALFHGVLDDSAMRIVRQKYIEGGGANGASAAVSSGTINVHTYFSYVPEIMGRAEISTQIQLWRTGWQTRGFNPVMLDENKAMAHPLYEKYKAKVAAFPTINVAAYEMACWLRWLAFSAVGGGVMSDYDVLPGSFRPDSIPKDGAGKFVLLEGSVPCAVAADKAGVEAFIAAVMEYEVDANDTEIGRPHLSDMHFVKRLLARGDKKPDWLVAHDLTKEYGEPGWQAAPLVHFAHGATSRHAPGKRKSEIMNPFLAGAFR